MIIGCQNCSARFIVKAQAIGENGRKVKCARCKHTWFQKPDMEVLEAAKIANVAESPKEVEPVPDGANVPVLKKKRVNLFLKIAAVISFVIFTFTLSLVASDRILPHMSAYYALFGIYDTTDIALYDVNVEKVGAGKYQDVLVKGKIVNQSNEIRTIPELRVTLLNDGNEKLKTITLASEGGKMEPGEKIDFEDRIPRIPVDSSKIIMDLGNSLDLASR